jgi:hypothetical protein
MVKSYATIALSASSGRITRGWVRTVSAVILDGCVRIDKERAMYTRSRHTKGRSYAADIPAAGIRIHAGFAKCVNPYFAPNGGTAVTHNRRMVRGDANVIALLKPNFAPKRRNGDHAQPSNGANEGCAIFQTL